MKMILLIAAVTLLMNGWPLAAQPAPTTEPATIRDIRGPLSPAGLPPFSGTVLLFAAALALAVTATVRNRSKPLAVTAPPHLPPLDDLDALQEAYACGELTADGLFRQLAAMARSRLIQGDSGALTGNEVIMAACESAPPDVISVATVLFASCDRVRFGASHPDAETVTAACAAVRQLLAYQPGTPP
jgi:hypothetical protein